MENLLLYNKLVSLPDDLKTEASDFIDFLVAKANQNPKKNKPVFGSGKSLFVMNPGSDQRLENFK